MASSSQANVVDVEDIPTWRQFYLANQAKIDALTNMPELSRMVTLFEKTLATEEEPSEFEMQFADKVSIWPGGDLTKLRAGAIVNAANKELGHGGGICGAIFDAAGAEDLREACDNIGKCPTGEARLTPGFALPSEYIIHAVGPMDRDSTALMRTYTSIYNVMKANGIRSVGVCCVSTGIYGFPNDTASMVALIATKNWLSDEDNFKAVDRIVFSTFLKQDYLYYCALMPLVFPCHDDAEESSREAADQPEEAQEAPVEKKEASVETEDAPQEPSNETEETSRQSPL